MWVSRDIVMLIFEKANFFFFEQMEQDELKLKLIYNCSYHSVWFLAYSSKL